MTLPIKVRRVDFTADDWLSGTVTMSLNERGLYITACALIYKAGGPVHKGDLQRICPCRIETFNSNLLRLVDAGKLQIRDGMIDQVRCERELVRAAHRISERLRIRDGYDSKPSDSSPRDSSENKEMGEPHARGKGVAKLSKEEVKNLEGGLGRCAPLEPDPPTQRGTSGSPPDGGDRRATAEGEGGADVAGNCPLPPSTEAKPTELSLPTEEEKAEVAALVEQAVAALKGAVPKGIRDAAAYKDAVTQSKFKTLARNVGAWVGAGLDGPARWAAWEVMAEVGRAEARSDLTPAVRKSFNELVEMYRVSAGSEAKEAA